MCTIRRIAGGSRGRDHVPRATCDHALEVRRAPVDDRDQVHDGFAPVGGGDDRGFVGDVAGRELALDACQCGRALRAAHQRPYALPAPASARRHAARRSRWHR